MLECTCAKTNKQKNIYIGKNWKEKKSNWEEMWQSWWSKNYSLSMFLLRRTEDVCRWYRMGSESPDWLPSLWVCGRWRSPSQEILLTGVSSGNGCQMLWFNNYHIQSTRSSSPFPLRLMKAFRFLEKGTFWKQLHLPPGLCDQKLWNQEPSSRRGLPVLHVASWHSRASATGKLLSEQNLGEKSSCLSINPWLPSNKRKACS